jgi:hypothetical protein
MQSVFPPKRWWMALSAMITNKEGVGLGREAPDDHIIYGGLQLHEQTYWTSNDVQFVTL